MIDYFRHHPQIRVALVLSNNPQAGVLPLAKHAGVPHVTFNRTQFYETNDVISLLSQHQISWVVLAGFLWLVPLQLVRAFPDRIINIHPALLPKFGGKGMYGMRVHQAVKEAGETTTGITIHLVNEQYDRGEIVFQAQCPVETDDTPERIARNVQALEHAHFAPVVERLIVSRNV